MTQTSIQYQLYNRRPNGNDDYLPCFPVEYFNTPEQALRRKEVYQKWEVEHQVTVMEYRVVKVTTIIEEYVDGY